MKKRVLLICALAGLATSSYAQRWEPSSLKNSQIRENVDVKYSYKLDLASLRNLLQDAVETGNDAKPVIISLPTVDGKIEKFAVYSNPVMEKSLADQYQLGSYVGVGIDDPTKYLRFSTSPTEMQSMIIKDGKFQFIEPISTDKQTYGVFNKTNRTSSEHGFECNTSEEKSLEKGLKSLVQNGQKRLSNVGITSRPSSTKYRTYRLALSVTGEYTQAAGGTVAGALTRMNNTMTRVNGVFEKDFGIHLDIQNYPGIIYTNASSDPYSNASSMSNWNIQLQRTLTSAVGSANYDIGHLFGATGGGGNAGCIGCICTDPTNNSSLAKGSGITAPADGRPYGDTFDIDYVAHEMGHQLGGNHTFSNTTEASGVNVEPGGGTTIMGYAGITPDNVQMNSDAYFHYVSINQILTNLEGKTTCGTATTITTNTPPSIAPLVAYSIPKGTAYYLETTATDAQNDPLTYTWEQYDSVNNTASISGDSGWGYNSQGSLQRSYFGTTSGRRYFPNFATVMAGNLTDKTNWETVSYIPRTLNYAVTVRDANTVRPMLSSSETTVTVGNDGPFKFNGLTTSTVLYNNASNTIQWEVANTSSAPYNVSNVKIDYTRDNGATWTDLVTSTPNNGSYTVQMPSGVSGTVKLRISAIGNVFYAVSPAITIGSAPTSNTAAPTGVSTIDSEILKTSARVSWNSVPGATYVINYRKVGATSWSNTTSTVNSVLLSGLEDETSYEVQVAAVVNSVQGSYSSNYTFKTKGLTTGVDYCILNSATPYYGNIVNVSLSNINYTNANMRSYKDVSTNSNYLINLVKGNQYTLSLTSYSSDADEMSYAAWIDYNRNGQFETDEMIFSQSSIYPDPSTYETVISAAFTVPQTAYSGDKTMRMRVASNYVNLPSACGYLNGGAGNVVDFTVKIAGNLAVNEVKDTKSSDISIYPNPADTFVEVKNLKGNADYKIYSADGRLVQQGKLENQRINVANLLKGVYMVTISSDDKVFNTKLIKK